MGADHREYWFAMTGWSLRPEFKPQAGADGPEAMQKQLYNLAFWYWAYDRICELGHDGSVQLSVLRGEWFAQFGVVGDQLCETFEQLLETQRKLKRMYVHREHVRVTKWQQHKLKGLRPIEQLIQERNRKRLGRKRDTDVTETGQSRDPRARAPTPTPTPTPDTRLQTPTIDASAGKPPRVADPRIKILIDYHFENFNKHQPGKKYFVEGKKDGSLLANLLKTYTEDEIKRADDNMFASEDEFIKASGYTIGVLYGCFNKLQLGGTTEEPILSPTELKRREEIVRRWRENQEAHRLAQEKMVSRNNPGQGLGESGDRSGEDNRKASSNGENGAARDRLSALHGAVHALSEGDKSRGGGFQPAGDTRVLRRLASGSKDDTGEAID